MTTLKLELNISAYVLPIKVGKNAQTFSLQVDTGSSDLVCIFGFFFFFPSTSFLPFDSISTAKFFRRPCRHDPCLYSFRTFSFPLASGFVVVPLCSPRRCEGGLAAHLVFFVLLVCGFGWLWAARVPFFALPSALCLSVPLSLVSSSPSKSSPLYSINLIFTVDSINIMHNLFLLPIKRTPLQPKHIIHLHRPEFSNQLHPRRRTRSHRLGYSYRWRVYH